MSTSEAPRGKTDVTTGRDREWKSQREQPPNSQAGPPSTPQQESLSHGPGSLRSRISDKETISRSLPHISQNSYRPDVSNKDDDRDSNRKRTLSGARFISRVFFSRDINFLFSDREKDVAEPASSAGSEQAAQVPKRPRIQRNRYAIAQKLLPIDPQVGDRKRSGRTD
jgi:THO complex subunit 2